MIEIGGSLEFKAGAGVRLQKFAAAVVQSWIPLTMKFLLKLDRFLKTSVTSISILV